MLRFVIPFERFWQDNPLRARAAEVIARFVKQRWGAELVYDGDRIPFGRGELTDLYELAEKLKRGGVIRSFGLATQRDDEPHLHQWRAECHGLGHNVSGGLSFESDREALIATLAEGLERYLWRSERDYFVNERSATEHEIRKLGSYLSPARFAGFSEQQQKTKRLKRSEDARYLWIRGYSWVHGVSTYVPAQVISGLYGSRVAREGNEPLLLEPITTGLATWTTQTGAVVRGTLEIIERDAYMIMWSNQLSLPRLDLGQLRGEFPSVGRLLETCARYRLQVEIVRLITDAPAYVLCAVVTDLTGNAPRITIGLKAHRNLACAIEDSILEALRARNNARDRFPKFKSDKKTEEIVHQERILYWCVDNRAERLAFLAQGSVQEIAREAWDDESDEAYLQRLIAWCKERSYEMVSVPLTRSKRNLTSLHVEMVVMPEMQPMHQAERLQYLGGERLKSVPNTFGFAPREKPFADEPHPFV